MISTVTCLYHLLFGQICKHFCTLDESDSEVNQCRIFVEKEIDLEHILLVIINCLFCISTNGVKLIKPLKNTGDLLVLSNMSEHCSQANRN